MARYIDANDLYNRVKTKTNPYGKPTLDYESGIRALHMIANAPTADVAPKSEVAREIFEEIEKIKKEYASGDIDGNELYVRLYLLEKKYTEG